MSTIHVLPDDLINKIAAGEVIERPASVVKELVENALDASSSAITVRLRNGGKDEIVVQDDASGIDDVETAILRHATSKLTTEDDLFQIMTLGFRGEALASICSIAKVTITTKLSSETIGREYVIEKGVILETRSAPCDTGTTIRVSDLFYNTPARKKFLKSKDVE